MQSDYSVSSPAPRVSIGLPVYNGQRFLRDALEMLAGQTFTDYELVIVDNGSTDGTSAICREYAARDARIRYIRYERTIPVVDNFCRVLAHARGEYFLWNPADDRRRPDAIERALEMFQRFPDAVMVHGPVELTVVREDRIATIPNEMDLTGTTSGGRVAVLTRRLQHNAMLYGVYRRSALNNVKFRQHPGHDYLVCLQMACIGRIRYTDTPLIRYHHVWGPVDNPMYDLEFNVKSLLADWGARRYKCWTVLIKGVHYLSTLPGVARVERAAATLAHLSAFLRRYWRHLLAEVVFTAATPIAWLAWPFVAARHRRRQERAADVRAPLA